MSLNAEEIIKILEKAKELGISTIKVDGLEAHSDTERPQEKSMTEIDDKDLMALVSPLDDFTEEEMLYYATPYFDELQEKKEAMKKQKKEEDELRGQ